MKNLRAETTVSLWLNCKDAITDTFSFFFFFDKVPTTQVPLTWLALSHPFVAQYDTSSVVAAQARYAVSPGIALPTTPFSFGFPAQYAAATLVEVCV